ncbi:hypothetical protein CDAR_243311 [Caerostris darwini]|uniref:Ycf1 n=1 Tax=Caerostris darwini TaxID=1538125 RepID=A0AAV4MLV1_9ARAC|nr:hypothetical protein CDAR_243311 [Caerostris darwini]
MISVRIEKDPKPWHHTLSKFPLNPFFFSFWSDKRSKFILASQITKNQFASGVEDPSQNYYYHGKQKSSLLASPHLDCYKLNKSPPMPEGERRRNNNNNSNSFKRSESCDSFLGGSSLPDPRGLRGTGKREKILTQTSQLKRCSPFRDGKIF